MIISSTPKPPTWALPSPAPGRKSTLRGRTHKDPPVHLHVRSFGPDSRENSFLFLHKEGRTLRPSGGRMEIAEQRTLGLGAHRRLQISHHQEKVNILRRNRNENQAEPQTPAEISRNKQNRRGWTEITFQGERRWAWKGVVHDQRAFSAFVTSFCISTETGVL